MRYITYKTSALILALLMMLSCAEDRIFDDREADGVPPSEVTINEIIPGTGKVQVNWTLPTDEDFLYVLVSYQKGDVERVLTYSKYNTEGIIIPNLKNTEYTFTFKTVDESGTVSQGVSASATPMKPAYETAAETVTASATIGAINFSWDNPVGDTLLASVYIEKEGGDSLVDIRYTGKDSYLRMLASTELLKYKIEFKDPELNKAVSNSIEIAASKEVKFDRMRFYSDYSGYSSFNRVFNGQFDVHFAMGGPFPKTIPFYCDKSIYVSRILVYVSRKSANEVSHFPKDVEVWTSESGFDDDYQKQGGVYTLKEVESDNSDWFDAREIALENIPKCRYIKLVVNSTYSNGQACVIGEMEVFGAEAE